MKARWSSVVVIAGYLLVGCTGKGSYRLHVVFPDAEARDTISELTLWVLAPGGRTCTELMSGEIVPDDLETRARVVARQPFDQVAALQQVPAGDALFFAEGVTGEGARILRGCEAAEVVAGAAVEVALRLEQVCWPDPSGEIPGNDVDDDCDGQTDECVEDRDCHDDNGCTLDACLLGGCHYSDADDGTPCNDRNPCTLEDHCLGGACEGEARDCSVFDGPCVQGVCDPQAGECEAEPRPDGTTCDDGQFCTEPDACSDGVCGGAPRDCVDADDCTRDACDEGEDTCTHALEPRPGQEGPSGDPTCSNGIDDDCDGITDAPDPSCGSCVQDSECEDGDPCTNDLCQDGQCEIVLVPDGAACDDGKFCTVDDACAAGACTGAERDCSGLSDACREGVCVESNGQCEVQEKPDGTGCDDGLFCTVADECAGGACAGSIRDCDDDDICTLDNCKEALQACDHLLQPIPDAEGPPGDPTCANDLDDDCDGLTDGADGSCNGCSTNEECDDSNPCTDDTCDAGECKNTSLQDGTVCDDGLYCTTPDACTGGVCGGPERDCSGVADACNDGVCHEDDDQCNKAPFPDGAACDDGDACTMSDACAGGVCSGAPLDADADTFVDTACGGDDCDDSDPDVHPGTVEGPYGYEGCGDGADNDCDTLTDEDDPSCDLPTPIYRSVGPGETAPLADGDTNALVVSLTTATFTSPLPDRIGVGDVLQYDADGDGELDALAVIHGRTSSTEYTVADVAGATPVPTAGPDQDWSVFRAYTSLSDVRFGTENQGLDDSLRNFDPRHEGPDLVAANQVMHIACYGGDPDTTPVDLNRYTTARHNYVRIFTPVSPAEVGTSQRHSGAWDDDAYRLVVDNTEWQGVVFVGGVEYLWLEGLQLENTGDMDAGSIFGLRFGFSGEYHVSGCIIRATGAGSGGSDDLGLGLPGGHDTVSSIFLWNNVISGFGYGIVSWFEGAETHGVIYNNTVIDCGYRGIALAESNLLNNVHLKNNLVQGAARNYDFRNLESSANNLSEDATSPDAGFHNRTVVFTGGAGGWHLSPSDTGARNQGVDLSADPEMAFPDDIDGQTRSVPWDIGADEQM